MGERIIVKVSSLEMVATGLQLTKLFATKEASVKTSIEDFISSLFQG